MPSTKWIRWMIYSSPFVLFYYGLLPCYTLPAEDASILFSYAENFSEYGKISYYPNGPNVFGTSDLLFLLATSLLVWLKLNVYTSVLLISALSSIIGVIALLSILNLKNKFTEFLIVALFFSATQHYAGIAGYSTIMFVATLLVVIKLLLNNDLTLLAICCFLLVTVRLEGLIYVLPILGIALYRNYKELSLLKVSSFLSWFVLPLALFFLTLNLIFGHILPLPFYVKASNASQVLVLLDQSSMLMNLHYLKFYLLPILTIIFLVGILNYSINQKLDNKVVFFLLLAAVNMGFYSFFRQEMNLFYRFQFPTFVLLILALGSFSNLRINKYPKVFQLFLILLIGLNLNHNQKALRTSLDRQYNNFYKIGEELAKINSGQLGTTESGIIPWLSKWESTDFWGLNTPKYARKLPSVEEIQDKGYDLIIMHARDEAYQSTFKRAKLTSKSTTEKTWDNMCINIAKATIDSSSYQLIMVPMDERNYKGVSAENSDLLFHGLISKQPHKRFDAFFIDRTGSNYELLREMLEEHGGIPK